MTEQIKNLEPSFNIIWRIAVASMAAGILWSMVYSLPEKIEVVRDAQVLIYADISEIKVSVGKLEAAQNERKHRIDDSISEIRRRLDKLEDQ